MTWASFVGSVLAVLAVVGFAKWLGFGRSMVIDEAAALRIAEDTFIGHHFIAAVIDHDAQAALIEGSAGEIALVRAHGDKWVTRLLDRPVQASLEGGRLIVRSSEPMFGATKLTLGVDEASRWAAKLRGERDA